MKTKLLALLLIISLSLCTVQFSYAAKWLQARMEKVYLQQQTKWLLKKQVKASDKDSDLHMTSVEIARQHALTAVHGSIEQIINSFRFSSPNCALSYDDASVLLVQNKHFKRYLNWIKDLDSDFKSTIDTSTFTKACIRFLVCKNGWKEWNSLSADEYDQCTNGIATQFTNTMNDQLRNNTLSNFSYGDEVFDNGSLEDSSFDINYDIEQIHKVLFANPKRIRSFYLRWPPNYLSNNILQPTKLFASNTVSLPNIEDAIKQIKAQDSVAEQAESNITSNLQCFDPLPIVKSDPAKEFKEQIKKLNNDTLDFQEEELIDDVIGTISQPYINEPPIPTITELPPEITDSLTDLQAEDRWWDPTPDGNSTQNNNNNCPVNNTNIGEQFDLGSKKVNIIACLKKCTSCEDWFFKKACFAGCLCSKHVNDVTDSSMFGLTIGTRLCLVPSTTPDIITPWTQIVSIQEIINQLWATIGKLKESGQYIPSSKPSEFFSPTTKIGNFGNLLNFKINVRSASKYTKPNNQNKVTETTSYYNNEIADLSQVQIESIISQQDSYSKLLTTHIEFRDKMNTILSSFKSAMESFKETQK